MSRLADCFIQLRQQGRKALMPYITAGDPDLDFTYAAASACVRAGADILELGIPFSDPLADGPTIQAAGKRALDNGVTFTGVLDLVRRLRQAVDVPIVLLVYYNTVNFWGEEAFVNACSAAGADALVVADLPAEESASLSALAAAAGLDLIRMVAPTSTSQRLAQATELATGFIYCVSVTGVTGARANLPASLQAFLEQVRARTDKPLVVGFGVSLPEHAVEATKIADGVIVGSALVGLLAEEAPKSRSGALAVASEFMAGFRRALDVLN